METRFDLLLVDQRRALRLFMAWLGAAVAATLGVLALVLYGSGNGPTIGIIGVAIGLLVLLLALRKAGRQPHSITVNADKLILLNQATGQATNLPFSTLKSYSFTLGRGNAMLQLKLRAGGHLALSTSTDFDQFGRMAQAVAAAIDQPHRLAGEAGKDFKVSSFWGNSAATVLLVLYALVLAVFASFAIWYYRSVDGSGSALFFFALLSVGFLLYAAGWYATRVQRH